MIKQLKFEDYPKALLIIKETMPEEVYNDAIGCLSEYSESRILFGNFIKSKLVGVCGYHFDGDKYWISWTCVCNKHQKKGIGQNLIDKVFSELKDKPAKFVSVETYEHHCFFDAIRFYLKNGFRIVGFLDDYLSDGSKVLYLRKQL